MRIFKDRNGQDWQIVLNVNQMKRIRSAIGIDLVNVITLDKDGVVKVYVKAPLSPLFFGWLMEVGPGTGLRLVYPKEAVEMYRERLKESLELYGE